MLKIYEQFCVFFRKTTPYGKIFKILFGKVFIVTPIDVFYSNLVKFGRRKISKIACYLPKKFFRLALQLLLLRGLRPKFARARPNNAVRVLQISSKSVHFRRSHSRTRNHRQNVP